MYSQTGLAERTFKAAFIYLAGYLVGVCHCGSDISDLFAVADLEHLDAGVHELLTQAVVGLESSAGTVVCTPFASFALPYFLLL